MKQMLLLICMVISTISFSQLDTLNRDKKFDKDVSIIWKIECSDKKTYRLGYYTFYAKDRNYTNGRRSCTVEEIKKIADGKYHVICDRIIIEVYNVKRVYYK